MEQRLIPGVLEKSAFERMILFSFLVPDANGGCSTIASHDTGRPLPPG